MIQVIPNNLPTKKIERELDKIKKSPHDETQFKSLAYICGELKKEFQLEKIIMIINDIDKGGKK